MLPIIDYKRSEPLDLDTIERHEAAIKTFYSLMSRMHKNDCRVQAYEQKIEKLQDKIKRLKKWKA